MQFRVLHREKAPYPEHIDEGQVEEGGVVDPHAGDGLPHVEPLQRPPKRQRREGAIGGEIGRPGEPDAVEPHPRHARRDVPDAAPRQALRGRGLQVRRPVRARQLHAPPVRAHHPPRSRRQRQRRERCCREERGKEEDEEDGEEQWSWGGGGRHGELVIS